MQYFTTILSQVAIMFILIALGYILFKIKIITTAGRKQLSSIILNAVCPALIFMVYQTELSTELLGGLLLAFLLSIISLVFGIVLAKLLCPKRSTETAIDQFSVIYSNCAFMGIPLINGIFGDKGVFYVTAYITLFNLLVWSHGIMLMKNEMNFKGLLTALKSPTIIAVFVGLIFYVTNIRIPEICANALNYIASLNTPVAMLIAGATIAETNILKAFAKPKVLFIAFLKLLLLPICMIFVFKIFGNIDKTVFTTIIIATACPTATIGTIFAVNYDKNAVYASEIFAVTTILTSLSLPIVVALCGIIA